MPKEPRSLRAAVITYFLVVAGLTYVGVQLSLIVTANVIALTLPHLASQRPPVASRVEQRRIDVAEAIPPMPVAKLTVLEAPAVSSGVLAAQLDSAEANEIDARPVVGGARKRLAVALRQRASARVPAADAFNRSFGVIPIASN
jgi:hypothetical protein